MQYISRYESPIGSILMAADEEGLIGLWFEGQKHFAKGLGEDYEEKEVPVFEAARNWLDQYFEGLQPEVNFPLHLKGSDFQREVWELLQEIPYGQTVTYGELGAIVGKRHEKEGLFSQAVGGAVSRNPISIIVPCHRVVGSTGSMTGYAGGINRKKILLQIEGVKVD